MSTDIDTFCTRLTINDNAK